MVKHAHLWDTEDKSVAADISTTLAPLRDAEAAGSRDLAPRNQAPRGLKRQAEGKGAQGKGVDPGLPW